MSELTPERVHEIAYEAAREAVTDTFLKLGVNTRDDDAVIAMQNDFSHLRAWRLSTDTVKRKGLAASVTFIVTAALGYFVYLFNHH
jgi:hypothetical protein